MMSPSILSSFVVGNHHYLNLTQNNINTVNMVKPVNPLQINVNNINIDNFG
uniref:Uncharacterized protein n=1 Tax=Tetranychus urticae TaxID=32264 RepID=T1KBM0_TETUR